MTEKILSALITRPYLDAYQTMDLLSEYNIYSIIEPMLSIEESEYFQKHWLKIPIEESQAIITTSTNAIRTLAKTCKHKHITLYTIGDNGRDIAENLGFDNVISASGNANNLYDIIVKRHKPEDGDLLYVSGDITSVDLSARLGEQKFSVHNIIAYHAIAASKLSPTLQSDIKNGNIDIALFFSERTAKTFEALIIENELADYTINITAFCLSKKISNSFQKLQWKKLFISEQPNQESLLELICKFRFNN